MTPRGGPGRGQGRKPRTNSRKHTIRIADDVWAYFEEVGTHIGVDGQIITDASRGLEIVARRDMEAEREKGNNGR